MLSYSLFSLCHKFFVVPMYLLQNVNVHVTGCILFKIQQLLSWTKKLNRWKKSSSWIRELCQALCVSAQAPKTIGHPPREWAWFLGLVYLPFSSQPLLFLIFLHWYPIYATAMPWRTCWSTFDNGAIVDCTLNSEAVSVIFS